MIETHDRTLALKFLAAYEEQTGDTVRFQQRGRTYRLSVDHCRVAFVNAFGFYSLGYRAKNSLTGRGSLAIR